MVDLSVLGMSVQEGSNAPLLLLRPRGARQVLSLRVSPMEAVAVTMALHGQTTSSLVRAAHGAGAPLADASGPTILGGLYGFLPHELMARLLSALGGRLLAVELFRGAEDGFSAELVLKTSAGLSRLDCRPADAIALALRCGAMLRIPRHLLAYAEDLDALMPSLPEHVRAAIEAQNPDAPWADAAGPAVQANPTAQINPLEVEAALAIRSAFAATEPGRQIINAAQKIIEQQGLQKDLEKILESVRQASVGQAFRQATGQSVGQTSGQSTGQAPGQASSQSIDRSSGQSTEQPSGPATPADPAADGGTKILSRPPKVEIRLVSIGNVKVPPTSDSDGSANRPGQEKPAAGLPAGSLPHPQGREEAETQPSGGISLAGDADGEGGKAPSIRVTLVRQRGKGEAEVLEEFQLPVMGVSKDVLSGLGLSRTEAEALGKEGSEEERWAMLLRMLAPETKVPM